MIFSSKFKEIINLIPKGKRMKRFLMMIAALAMTTMMAQANEEASQAVQDAAAQAVQEAADAAPAEEDNATKEEEK